MRRNGKRHKGKEMGVPVSNRSRKFHALKEIAEAKKKGKENDGRNLWIDNWIDARGGQR